MAAADYRWIATTSDWALDGNWDQGSEPSQSDGLDRILFDGTSNVSPTVNMDRTGDAPNLPSQITTMPAFSGNIGSPGNPLHIEIASGEASEDNNSFNFTHRGSGTVYLKGSAGGVMDVVCDAPRTFGDGLSMQLDGVLRNVFIKRGRVEIVAGAGITARVIVFGSETEVVIRKHAGGGSAGDLIMIGGHVTNYRPVGTAGSLDSAIVAGGTLTQIGVLGGSDSVLTLGGTFDYRPEATSANEPSIYALAGTFYLGQSLYKPAYDLMILGPTISVSGDPFTGNSFTIGGAQIDLRADYP